MRMKLSLQEKYFKKVRQRLTMWRQLQNKDIYIILVFCNFVENDVWEDKMPKAVLGQKVENIFQRTRHDYAEFCCLLLNHF
jgi:hypothetical protein